LSVQQCLPVLLTGQETTERVTYTLLGHAIVRRLLRNPKARIRSKARQCGICGGQSSSGTGLSPTT